MQRELLAGRDGLVRSILGGRGLGLPPRGTIFPRLWLLLVLSVAILITSLFLHHNLVSHLATSTYSNLFANLLNLRLILYYTLAGGCLVWYSRALTELRRECLAVERLRARQTGRGQSSG